MFAQVDVPWRKALTKVEGEEEYEALDKVERLEVYQDHIRQALDPHCPSLSALCTGRYHS